MSWFELNFMEKYWYDGDDDGRFACNEIICSISWHKFHDEDKSN